MKIIGLIVALLLVFSVLGCQSTPTPAPAPAAEVEVEFDADDEGLDYDEVGDE